MDEQLGGVMNIGDNGYTRLYCTKYTNLEDGVQALLGHLHDAGLSPPPKEAITIRPNLKRIDILYNPETKLYASLHQE